MKQIDNITQLENYRPYRVITFHKMGFPIYYDIMQVLLKKGIELEIDFKNYTHSDWVMFIWNIACEEWKENPSHEFYLKIKNNKKDIADFNFGVYDQIFMNIEVVIDTIKYNYNILNGEV